MLDPLEEKVIWYIFKVKSSIYLQTKHDLVEQALINKKFGQLFLDTN
jgi:hypothetical protein